MIGGQRRRRIEEDRKADVEEMHDLLHLFGVCALVDVMCYAQVKSVLRIELGSSGVMRMLAVSPRVFLHRSYNSRGSSKAIHKDHGW